MPLISSRLYPTQPGTIIVAAGTELVAISVDTGETRWTSKHDNPGRGGPYGVDGNYQDLIDSPTTGAYIGLITAQRPYRD